MKKLYWLSGLIILSVLFFQCQKEVGFVGGPDTGVPVKPDPITASIQGNITIENNQPASGVLVTVGSSTAITDVTGYFHINNAQLDKNTTLVTVQKDGYFTGYRVLAATSGCNQVAIKLEKKGLAATIPSAAGGEAVLSGGARVSLPANSVVTAATNSNYNGDIKVYTAYIDPKGNDFAKRLPGSLVANDKDGKRVALASYGMLAVELSSASGEKLQVKNGSVATLTMPIPFQSVASAPAIIPLWYLDESTGLWMEEGTATKQGSNYVGEVKHFSFWNCDQPFDAVNLSLTLHTPDGLPLAYATVKVSEVTPDTSIIGASAFGYTDSLGQVKGLVPKNMNLKLEVFGSCSGTIAYSQDVMPLTQDKDLGVMKIESSNPFLLTITGTVLNCSSAPVTKGYAIVNFDGIRHNAATDASGRFTTAFLTCSRGAAEILVSGIDAENLQQGDQTATMVSLPLTDIGSIVACGKPVEEQYIYYTLDGTDYSITSLNGDSLAAYDRNPETRIFGYKLPSFANYISFSSITNNTGITGTFALHELTVQSSGDTVKLNADPKVTFSEFPNGSGQWYGGHFDNVSFIDSVTHTISARFRIKKS